MILHLRLEDGARKAIKEVEKCTDVFFPHVDRLQEVVITIANRKLLYFV